MTTTLVAIASQHNTSDNVAVSTDGISWATNSNLPKQGGGTENTWVSICYAHALNIFCAVASTGGANHDNAAVTGDGVTWQGTISGTSSSDAWNSVCWSEALGLFCAVGNGTNKVMTSPDGRTWTARTASEANAWSDVCWAAGIGLFVAVAPSGTHQVMTSPDGITWTNRTHADTNCTTVVWDPVNARLVAAGTDWPNYQWSDDASSWTSVNGGWVGNAQCVYALDGGGFGMAGHNDINRYDADGKGTWTAGAGMNQGGFSDSAPKSVTWSYALSLYVAVFGGGPTTSVSTSPDGHTWTQRTLSTANPWKSVADSSQAPPPRPFFQTLVIS